MSTSYVRYVRPYLYIASHIKSHAIDLNEFQALYQKDMNPAILTEYYDGNKIFTVTQNKDKRELTYRQLHKQSTTDLGKNQECVVEESSFLPVLNFQNQAEHQHIRQKIVLTQQESMRTLEILLHEVLEINLLWSALPGLLTDMAVGVNRAEILSLSYRNYMPVVLKTNV